MEDRRRREEEIGGEGGGKEETLCYLPVVWGIGSAPEVKPKAKVKRTTNPRCHALSQMVAILGQIPEVKRSWRPSWALSCDVIDTISTHILLILKDKISAR